MCVGQGLSAPIVQPIIRRIFESIALEHFKNFTKWGGFKVSLEWMKDFMKYHLNWLYWATTRATRKLPSTCEVEGTSMAHQVVYLVKMYNIPPCLVVDTNQTRVHLVPTRGDQTWGKKGSKHVQVLGIEDKRKIAIVVSFSTNWSMLPLQVVFQGTTSRAFPPMNERRKNCLSSGFHPTYSSNH